MKKNKKHQKNNYTKKNIYFEMTKEEQKIASVYYNSHLPNYFIGLIFSLALLTLFPNLQNSTKYKDGQIIFGLFFLIILIMNLFAIFQIISDKSFKQKIKLEGVFNAKGLSVDSRYVDINFMCAKIDKINVIFPPDIYYRLNKGDYIEIYCTRILNIAVDYKVITPTPEVTEKK